MKNDIFSNAPLIDKQLIERVKQLTPASLCDSMANCGAMEYRVSPMWKGASVAGTAITVQMAKGDNLLLHQAICQSAPGYVLVAASDHNETHAVWGDNMSRAAMQAGAEGLVTDGVVRDIDDIEDMKFPVFAIGAVPQPAYQEGPGAINVPIICGGVSVHPGDLVVGGRDGVAVVPRCLAEEVIRKAEAKLTSEAARIADIKKGILAPDWLAERLQTIGILLP